MSVPTLSSKFKTIGMVKIARQLVDIHMSIERGTFPRAMAVRIVPDDTVTGPTPIMQIPMTNSYGSRGNANNQARMGYSTKDDNIAATGALKLFICRRIPRVSRQSPVEKHETPCTTIFCTNPQHSGRMSSSKAKICQRFASWTLLFNKGPSRGGSTIKGCFKVTNSVSASVSASQRNMMKEPGFCNTIRGACQTLAL